MTVTAEQAPGTTLLGAFDPAPVTVVNPDAQASLVLVCEHAGQAIPAALGDLGLAEAHRKAHIGWDIGAAAVARCMAERLGVPLVLQNYSRLVIDCNRPPEAADSVPETSDGVEIVANLELDEAGRRMRVNEIFRPFDAEIARLLARRECRAAFSIHSFNPLLGGVCRPWDIGFLYRKDLGTSKRLMDAVTALRPDLLIGINQPYSIGDSSDWFVPRYAERLKLAHSLIEIRNDHIADAAGQRAWAELLAAAIETTIGGRQ